MTEYRLLPREQMNRPHKRRVSPIDKVIADLPGTFYKMSDVAEILGVSLSTIRRRRGQPGVKAPSMVFEWGKGYVYLYTPADVEELRQLVRPQIRKESA